MCTVTPDDAASRPGIGQDWLYERLHLHLHLHLHLPRSTPKGRVGKGQPRALRATKAGHALVQDTLSRIEYGVPS